MRAKGIQDVKHITVQQYGSLYIFLALNCLLPYGDSMNKHAKTVVVAAIEKGQRLDIWCVGHFPALSRSAIQRAIKEGQITVNGHIVKPRYAVQASDQISALQIDEKKQASLAKTDISLPILYEDRYIVVINKPAGIVVHPGHGVVSDTVVQWFAQRFPESVSVGDPQRPGVVHRLDKDTSGVLVLARDQQTFENLKDQFKKHRVRKEYMALVFGVPGESKGRITRPLARSKRNPLRRTVDPEGKEAITEWKKEESFQGKYALLRVFPMTGRMHQIRVHLHFLGFPIVGDALYTFKRQRSPQGVTHHLLHAEKLTVMLPGGKRKTFLAPLPDDFANTLSNLRDKTRGHPEPSEGSTL